MTDRELALEIDSGCHVESAIEAIRRRDALKYAAVVEAARALVRELYKVRDWEGTPVDACVDNVAKALFETKGLRP